MVTTAPREGLLARFERLIDLPAFLGQRGFEASANPTAAGLTMLHPATGETLLLRKDLATGTWSYSSSQEPTDRGTITDYLERRDHLSRDTCLERLIACVDLRRNDYPEAFRYRAYALGQPEPLGRAVAAYLQAAEHEHKATKALDRVGISRTSLDQWRFGDLKTSQELAQALRDPTRDLWSSRYRATDRTLVLTERPIDAISFEQSRGNRSCCYLATGSRLDETKKRRIAAVLADVPPGISVVLAFGRDEQGRQLARQVQALAPAMKMERLAPQFGARWNDQVQLERRHARSLARADHNLAR